MLLVDVHLARNVVAWGFISIVVGKFHLLRSPRMIGLSDRVLVFLTRSLIVKWAVRRFAVTETRAEP
jgi:hypothetical protein